MADFERPLADFEEHNDPRHSLQLFVAETNNLMNETITESAASLEDEMVDDLRTACEELQGRIHQIIEALAKLKPKVIADHALEGENLKAKLKVVDVRHRQYKQALAEGLPRNYLLRKTYKAINTLLKSAVGSLPGGGALVELKETIENSIKK